MSRSATRSRHINARRELGGRIRSYRLAAGLTQLEIGQRVGVTKAGISVIEIGRVWPSLPLLLDIANAVGVPPETFVRRLAGEQVPSEDAS